MGYADRHDAIFTDDKRYIYRGTWLQLMRPLTLSGTITPTLVGTGLAMKTGFFSWYPFVLFLISAMLIQMTVNMFNDYFDFLHGQDEDKWQEVDSNDSRHGVSLHMNPVVAVMFILLASTLGYFLALASTMWIIPVGIVSIFAGIKYSAGKHAFASIAMGEVIAFLFLGVVVTVLAYVVQTNIMTAEIVIAGVFFGLLIASMILTNNIRDIEKDKPFRKTLAILLGRKRAIQLLKTGIVLLYVSVIFVTLSGLLSMKVLLVMLALPMGMKLLRSFQKKVNVEKEAQVMKWAALHHMAFGLLFALAVWL